MSFNEHTGDKLQTKIPSDAYKIGWDQIFNKKKECCGQCKKPNTSHKCKQEENDK